MNAVATNLARVSLLLVAATVAHGQQPQPTKTKKLTKAELRLVDQFQQQRIDAIDGVIGSVIAIYGEEKQGGGSGVIIDPSGIGLTNHHVIMGAGTSGWGGLADGKLYRWKLVGTDPGGDVSIIQLEGRDDFPFAELGDSDQVAVGDWVLTMGNPFLLTEDQSPTVTVGIVSGVKRYQPGAGQNQLVYGNCIQTDSSINPGNSGGPLFNMDGQIIGINGRGSFKERGRVNVGLGYAISANQIRNFIPDLLATKLVEHGTLDANFEDRDGKVVCANLYEDSKLYRSGIRPGDQLLEFEGEPIETANEFTNLICTLPEEWPASLTFRRDGEASTQSIHTRLYGLPYAQPQRPNLPPDDQDQTPEQKEQLRRAKEMIELLSAPPGKIRDLEINRHYAEQIVAKWQRDRSADQAKNNRSWRIQDRITKAGEQIGSQTLLISADGGFSIETNIGEANRKIEFDGKSFQLTEDGRQIPLLLADARLEPAVVQVLGIQAANQAYNVGHPFAVFGDLLLDGSDKAIGRNAWRFRLDHEEDNSGFYFWLSTGSTGFANQLQLAKAAGDTDGERRPGGIIFNGWDSIEGIQIARRRTLVLGLGEAEQMSFELQQVSQLKPTSGTEDR